jgi:hypothetical protein
VKADIRLGSYAGDGQQDLYFIPWGSTGSARVEVHVLSAASTYQTFSAHVATPLPTAQTAAGDWSFLVGDLGGRGDLTAVRSAGVTGSGRTEVHVLSQASSYQGWSLHAATPLQLLAPNSVSFELGKFDGDGVADLIFVLRGPSTGSGHTELHALSGASGYGTYVGHFATALGSAAPTTWQFDVG